MGVNASNRCYIFIHYYTYIYYWSSMSTYTVKFEHVTEEQLLKFVQSFGGEVITASVEAETVINEDVPDPVPQPNYWGEPYVTPPFYPSPNIGPLYDHQCPGNVWQGNTGNLAVAEYVYTDGTTSTRPTVNNYNYDTSADDGAKHTFYYDYVPHTHGELVDAALAGYNPYYDSAPGAHPFGGAE